MHANLVGVPRDAAATEQFGLESFVTTGQTQTLQVPEYSPGWILLDFAGFRTAQHFIGSALEEVKSWEVFQHFTPDFG